jgi:hypothetical protein
MDLANIGLQPALCEHELPFKVQTASHGAPSLSFVPSSITQKTRIYKSISGYWKALPQP